MQDFGCKRYEYRYKRMERTVYNTFVFLCDSKGLTPNFNLVRNVTHEFLQYITQVKHLLSSTIVTHT